MKSERLNIIKSYKYSLIYISVFLLISGVANYYTWSKEGIERVNLLFVLVWIALYAPLFIYHKYSDWQICEFGFTFNYKSLIFLIVVLVISFLNKSVAFVNDWNKTFIEVFARTGEELFFRGFLYALFLKMFKNQKSPWIWAVILSSLLFMVVHTQTFLLDYSNNMIDVLKMGIIFALLRKWTNSILPGLLLHMIGQTYDLLGCILSFMFYYLFVLVSYLKKEKVL